MNAPIKQEFKVGDAVKVTYDYTFYSDLSDKQETQQQILHGVVIEWGAEDQDRRMEILYVEKSTFTYDIGAIFFLNPERDTIELYG